MTTGAEMERLARDSAAIAAKLSPSQRKAMLWLPGDGSEREHVKGSPTEVSFFALKEKIVGKPREQVAAIYRLVERTNSYQPVNGKWPNAIYRLTPLGLAVRRILTERPNDERK